MVGRNEVDPGTKQQYRGRRKKTSSLASGSSSSTGSRFSFHESEYSFRTRTSLSESDKHSLIKRAAKSALLDEATPTGSGTIFSSGDASDDEHESEKNKKNGKPNMKSLETPSLPAIPDEQDRKRFVGCLAAVLSSMYDYESYDLLSKENNQTKTDSKNNGNNNHHENDNDVSGFFDFYESSDEDDEPPIDGGMTSEGMAATASREKLTKLHSAIHTTTNNNNNISPAPSNDTSDTFYSRRCQSFESIGSSSASSRPPQAVKPVSSSFRRQAANAQQMKNNNNNNNTADNNVDPKAQLSRQRYLSRRYELYSGLLLTSSELLLLDKAVARAFLPMLSRVLVPQIHRTHENKSPSPKQQQEERSQTDPKERESDGGDPSMVSDAEDDNPTISLSPTIHLLDNVDELSPFLDSLTPGSGFRCVSLLLLQYLLNSENGYDARIRHPIKKLSILALERDMEDDEDYDNAKTSGQEHRRRRLLHATRRFEALEQNIARRLILLSSPARNRKSNATKKDDSIRKTDRPGNGGITRDQIVRGVKIGGAGILAGTLFAVTGPFFAAGMAGFMGAAAGTAAVSALTSVPVVTTIFGVGGGGLAAYKMQRRIQGVTEFEFCRETKGRPDRRGSRDPETDTGKEDKIEAELFSILCISGWLRDQCDYQRPWGLQPTHPRIADRLERLERFYSIYSPDHLPKCERILSSWKGEEDELWKVLREKYGRDPDHLFPLENVHQSGNTMAKGQGALTLEQEEVLDNLFVELGYHSVAPEQEKSMQHVHENQMSPLERIRNGWKNRRHSKNSAPSANGSHLDTDSMHGPTSDQETMATQQNQSISGNTMLYSYQSGSSEDLSSKQQDEESVYKAPKHLSTVWDWKSTYGGEMYTVKWESELLTQICDCVTDLAVDVVTGATRQILKHTVFNTLVSAFVWPTYLLNLVHMIDGDWTIAVERADEAGIVLAKTLLYSRAGRRPVTLVGYSFGARIIYSCLKELARCQEEWEHYQELLEEFNHSADGSNHRPNSRLAKYQKKMKGMREPASIVEDAVLLGLPNHLSLSSWKACRQVVAGRLVNCYSNNDLILSLMFQAKRFSGGSLSNGNGFFLKPVCGTCPVEEPGVENVDCSDLILGHQDYCLETGKVLERIGFGEPIRCLGETATASNEKS